VRRDDFGGFFPPSQPLPARGGIKAASRRGAFGQSWWARRWIGVLEALELGGRLARGRSYARRGQVLSIAIEKGRVDARVQGSRREPYDVAVEVATLSGPEWRRVAAALSREARFAASLLAGQMAADVEDAFRAAGLSLFPERRQDLGTACSCPDASNPCKHIAAVYYLLGEEFDRDPFLVFRLRGLERDALVGLLGAAPSTQRTAPAPASPASAEPSAAPARPAPEPLPDGAEAFWQGGALPEDFLGRVEPPPVTGALLGRLGPFPFWRGREPLFHVLTPAYQAASSRGLDVLVSDARPGEAAPSHRRT
jgi:uncharacterized Zn finger protein